VVRCRVDHYIYIYIYIDGLNVKRKQNDLEFLCLIGYSLCYYKCQLNNSFACFHGFLPNAYLNSTLHSQLNFHWFQTQFYRVVSPSHTCISKHVNSLILMKKSEVLLACVDIVKINLNNLHRK